MKVIDLKNDETPVKFVEGTEWDRVTQDYIRQYKGIISSEDCKLIIDSHKDLPFQSVDEWDDHQWVEITQNDKRLSEGIDIRSKEIDDILFKTFGDMLRSYALDYWRVASCRKDTGYTLLKYSEGDHAPIHHSPAGESVAAMIYLNDNCEGGELQFFGKEKTQALEGTGVIYPASFMFPNEILPVTKGTRYTVVTSFK